MLPVHRKFKQSQAQNVIMKPQEVMLIGMAVLEASSFLPTLVVLLVNQPTVLATS